MKSPVFLGAGLLCLFTNPPVRADDSAYGKFDADLRFRHEHVQQDNALEDADASTLHARFGFTSRAWNELTFSVQGEAVAALGSEDYNNGPDGNGHTDFSVIPDPDGEELNQLWLAWDGLPDTRIKLGRQRIIYDNARFVGNVGWRQNEQTYDGITLRNNSFSDTRIEFAHLVQVNNIFFQDKKLEQGNLLNLNHSFSPKAKLGAYAYYLDYEPGMGGDNKTLGLRLSGALFASDEYGLTYHLEYAEQSDYADAASFDLGYHRVELKLDASAFSLKAGQENLGGDGTRGFSTPLATLHAFNGWADQFLATPATGLTDRFVGASTRLGAAKLQLVYHDFGADQGGNDHGSEWDTSLGFSPAPGWSLLLKYADYSAQATSVDTEKLWAQVAYKF